jgi:hypothetical protein
LLLPLLLLLLLQQAEASDKEEEEEEEAEEEKPKGKRAKPAAKGKVRKDVSSGQLDCICSLHAFIGCYIDHLFCTMSAISMACLRCACWLTSSVQYV